MFLRNLSQSVTSIQGIGPSNLSKLAKLGIRSAGDLLTHYPRGWEDRENIIKLCEYRKGKVCTKVTVLEKEWIGFGAMKTMKVYIEDESAQGSLLCFKRPWLEKLFIKGEKYMIHGVFRVKYGEIQSSSFEAQPLSSQGSFGKIIPVYPLTSGLKQNQLRSFIQKTMESFVNEIEDELPAFIIEKNNLLNKKNAIKEIHFPSSMDMLERAKKTLIYEELFYLEAMVAKRSIERKNKFLVSQKLKIDKPDADCGFSPLQKRLIERLPFSLTKGQLDAVKEINRDIASNVPMARLLQGDVGSGKTLVSFLASLAAVEGSLSKNDTGTHNLKPLKGQAAIMAPTELLARQHAENAARLLEPLGVKIAFLTGNIKSQGRRELLKNLASGDIDIIAGTHALFSSDVIYKNLKLAVIDEQHRFGVTQRAKITAKGENADLLMMSATPIPRTLALTVFGDMDVSVIGDMPEGRKPVITHLAKQSNEKKVYDFVRRELEKGRQAYFVYPLIDGQGDIKDAVSMAQRLSKEIFANNKTELIHSKLPEEEKKKIMDSFRKGEIDILAATSVVEVGVDVPNAACMVIEHAERFGLSALHQLRGRVGRGSEQSYCFLVYSDEYTQDAKTRLLVMLNHSDGFVIAEEDLKLRGPGQIAGTEQSGYLVLGIANPVRDIKELEKAREDVFSILENDPDLLLENHQIIAKVLREAPPFCDVEL